MGSKRERGVRLLKCGYSYNQIRDKLGIAKSTINNWFNKLEQNEKKKIKSFRIKNWRRRINKYLIKKRKQTLDSEAAIRRASAARIVSITKNDLLLIGTSLYWAEGSKTNRWQLQFSNSDPSMVKIMMKFLREVCRIPEEKFYLQLILHQNIKANSAFRYWSKITKIPNKQFKKPCYSLSKSSKNIRKRRQLPFGTLQIRILDKKFTQQIYGFIEGLKSAAL